MSASTNRNDSATYKSARESSESKNVSVSSISSDTQRTIRTSRQTGEVSVRITTRPASQNNQTDG